MRSHQYARVAGFRIRTDCKRIYHKLATGTSEPDRRDHTVTTGCDELTSCDRNGAGSERPRVIEHHLPDLNSYAISWR